MSLKQKIFEKLDKDSYILDQEYFKLVGKDEEPNFTTLCEYKRQWGRLQADKSFFMGKKCKLEKHGKTRIAIMEDGTCYKVGKEYYEMERD